MRKNPPLHILRTTFNAYNQTNDEIEAVKGWHLGLGVTKGQGTGLALGRDGEAEV